MDLPRPPSGLDPDLLRLLTEWADQIQSADTANRKTSSDVEIANRQRFIMLGDDGLKYSIAIVGGVLTPTAL